MNIYLKKTFIPKTDIIKETNTQLLANVGTVAKFDTNLSTVLKERLTLLNYSLKNLMKSNTNYIL